MPRHDIDLVTFHLAAQGGRRLLGNNAVAQLAGHLMHIRRVEIKLLGYLVIRQVEAHEIQAQEPHSTGLMVAGKDRVSQIVEAPLTGLTQIALTLGLGFVAPLFRHLSTVASWTLDAVRPAYVPDGLKTFGVVDEGLYVYHDASITY